MAPSSSMTRMRGLAGIRREAARASIDADGLQGAADPWLVDVQREHVASVCRRHHPAIVVHGAYGMPVDFEQHVPALDIGVEGRAHRIDTRHDDTALLI